MMKIKALMASSLFALSGLATADTVIESGEVEVCATVNAWLLCEWANGNNKFNFGELNTNKGVVDPADLESRLTMTVRGTPGVTFYMQANAGQNFTTTRRMFKPAGGGVAADYLTYELHMPTKAPAAQPTTGSPLWGDNGVTHPGNRFTFTTNSGAGDTLQFLAAVTEDPNQRLPGDYTDVVQIESGY